MADDKKQGPWGNLTPEEEAAAREEAASKPPHETEVEISIMTGKPKQKNKHRPKTTKARPGIVRQSTTGGPGTKIVDQSGWRRKLQQGRIKFTDDLKDVFLQQFAETGLMMASAAAATVTYTTVEAHIKNDPDFLEAFMEAKQMYRDKVIAHANKLMFEGTKEPIIGGEFRDEVVAYKTVYPTNLIAMEMRRVEHAYREKQEVDLNVKGGVLVMPAPVDPNEWERMSREHHAKMMEYQGVTIDVTPEKK